MRAITLIYMIFLASCASVQEQPPLEDRLSSWAGAPLSRLVDALGNPSETGADWYEWRFSRPGMTAARSTNAVMSENRAACATHVAGSVGCPDQQGLEPRDHTSGGDTAIPASECAYHARVDGETVVEVVAMTVVGICEFDRIVAFEAGVDSG